MTASTNTNAHRSTPTPPPTSVINWDSVGFKVHHVNGHAHVTWSNGKWGNLEFRAEESLQIHGFASCLNYGQQCFEGLKAFRGKDGKIRIFRPDENAIRLAHSARMISVPPVPEELFLEAVNLAVARNAEFVPPYGLGASLYIRPLLLGTGPELGLSPPKEFTFVVYVTPGTPNLRTWLTCIGNYYTGGIKPVDAIILEDFDRAAPLGTGTGKLGGNYSPVFKYSAQAKHAGYAITLHLDSKTRTYIDEFSTSNFVALLKDSSSQRTTFVVPESSSILKSVTTKSLIELSKSFGWTVEMRAVPWSEVAKFSEVAACGTAAVITPIKSITNGDVKIEFGDGDIGPGFLKLFETLRAIQDGNIDDQYGWMWPKAGVDCSA